MVRREAKLFEAAGQQESGGFVARSAQHDEKGVEFAVFERATVDIGLSQDCCEIVAGLAALERDEFAEELEQLMPSGGLLGLRRQHITESVRPIDHVGLI